MPFDVINGASGAVNGITPETPAPEPAPTTKEEE